MTFAAVNMQGRLEELEAFDLHKCNRALRTPELQKTVKLALERRIRKLRWKRKNQAMSFEAWYKRRETRVWAAMPWLKGDLREAYEAGRKYKRTLQKRKQKESKA